MVAEPSNSTQNKKIVGEFWTDFLVYLSYKKKEFGIRTILEIHICLYKN